MYVGRRYQYSKFGMQTEQPLKSPPSKKIYAFRPTDTILNPERHSSKGIKIVRKI